jgi:hypothetical protein
VADEIRVIAREQGRWIAHERVRQATKTKGRHRVEPKLPVDVLGVYVCLPAGE